MRLFQRGIGVVALICLLLSVSGLSGEGICGTKEDQDRAKQVVAEARKIENPNQSFEIKLWAEGDKKSFKVGDMIAFKFASSENAYVTLLSIATDGKVYKIFPNKWHKDGKVEKGKEYTFPPSDSEFVFKVKGPEGMEYIKAIATLQPLLVVTKVKADSEQPVDTVDDPQEVMKNVAVELKKRESKTWTESLVSFGIKEEKPDKQ